MTSMTPYITVPRSTQGPSTPNVSIFELLPSNNSSTRVSQHCCFCCSYELRIPTTAGPGRVQQHADADATPAATTAAAAGAHPAYGHGDAWRHPGRHSVHSADGKFEVPCTFPAILENREFKKWKFSFFSQRHTLSTSFDIFIYL